ncbi:MAG: glutamate 5-kinase [Deltaproteobacteria bacterium]|nr:glutamate 5-kinase [Deltaproteobacteria bacterium]
MDIQSKKIVVKIGSSVIVDGDKIDRRCLANLVKDIAYLIKEKNKDVVIVSSGAVACGIFSVGLKEVPVDIVKRQAFASIGQVELMKLYQEMFCSHNLRVSQILITADDIYNRRRYLNARNTISLLLSWNIVPVVNENDTVVIKELKFGDNDNLSSYVTDLVGADTLIILTDVDGLFTADPKKKSARFLPLVEFSQKEEVERFAFGSMRFGCGGMKSKVEIGFRMAEEGKMTIIANGKEENILRKILNGEARCTIFIPEKSNLTSKKVWLKTTLRKGKVFIDGGAREAICEKGKSLLPSGIEKIEGVFERGDIVDIVCNGKVIARGIANYNSQEIEMIKGLQSKEIESVIGYKYSDDVVHRNNMVLIGEKNA